MGYSNIYVKKKRCKAVNYINDWCIASVNGQSLYIAAASVWQFTDARGMCLWCSFLQKQLSEELANQSHLANNLELQLQESSGE